MTTRTHISLIEEETVRDIERSSSDCQNPAIVIPAFNESGSLAQLLWEVQRVCGFPIYLVNDASTDKTAEVAQQAGVTVLNLAHQMGAWGATQTGIRYALLQGHDAVVTLDADGQHNPSDIPRLLIALKDCDADVCIGAWPQRGSMMRQFAWKLLRFTSGIRLEDLTSGYRAYNLKALQVLAEWRATCLDFQDIGVLSLLLRQRLRVVDTPTEMRDRSNGGSRVFYSWMVVARYMAHTLFLGLSKRSIRRYKPRKI